MPKHIKKSFSPSHVITGIVAEITKAKSTSLTQRTILAYARQWEIGFAPGDMVEMLDDSLNILRRFGMVARDPTDNCLYFTQVATLVFKGLGFKLKPNRKKIAAAKLDKDIEQSGGKVTRLTIPPPDTAEKEKTGSEGDENSEP